MLTHFVADEAHFLGMKIGDQIRAAREEMGLSQREFSLLIGVSHGYVGQWESHHKPPGRERLIKIAQVTGKPISFFIEGLPPDPAKLTITDPDAIELVRLFGQMSREQREGHLQLFRVSVRLRAEVEHKRKPAKGKCVKV